MIYPFRLLPKQDLRGEIEKYAKENGVSAGFIITCVGSLEKAVLRLSDEKVKEFSEHYEIVSLVGTVCSDGSHLHMSIADKDGIVYGGHVKYGCIVYTTAEVVLGSAENLKFNRVRDEKTGFDELSITHIK